MKHDFDKVIDRRNTNSVKYDFAAECGMPEDVLPLWVADMDFQAPETVRQRLAEISRFGIYGYSKGSDGSAGACFAEDDGRVRVEFDEPQRAITAGQAVVVYDGDVVVGGGTIVSADDN